jgi:hypothetical protein
LCRGVCARAQFEAPFHPMRGSVLFYYSPSAPLKTYSENPICQSYLGSNCVAMGAGVKDDWSRVCVSVCLCVCLCVCVRVLPPLPSSLVPRPCSIHQPHMHTCTQRHLHTCTHAHTHTYTHTSTHTRIHMHTYTRTHRHTREHEHTHTHAHTHTYTCTYTHIHMHIHTHKTYTHILEIYLLTATLNPKT